MKIGLITYHHSINYGAVMQSYATCRALRELGHEVELINIEQPEKKSSRSFIFYFKLKAFRRFMQQFYPQETCVFHSLEELRAHKFNYDCLIVGSDQVWNPDISKDKCMAYFLAFGDEKTKRLSYASSYGIERWDDEKRSLLEQINKALRKFHAISVREATGAVLTKSLFGLEASVVLDPTLLHSRYDEITGPFEENHKIVGYLLNRTPVQIEKSIALARELGAKPIMISTIWYTKGFTYVYPPSIERWIRYIGGSRFVITDSFHGVAFSIIYRRNFLVITPENGKNSRLRDLLSTCELMDRYFTDSDEIPYKDIVNVDIDYNRVYELLNKQKEFSWNYLKENLND